MKQVPRNQDLVRSLMPNNRRYRFNEDFPFWAEISWFKQRVSLFQFWALPISKHYWPLDTLREPCMAEVNLGFHFSGQDKLSSA